MCFYRINNLYSLCLDINIHMGITQHLLWKSKKSVKRKKRFSEFYLWYEHNIFRKAKLLPSVHISVSTLLSGLIWCNQTKSRQTNVGLTSVRWGSGIENWQNRILPCVSVSAQKGVPFSRQMADLLVCGAKAFSHVQIFAPDRTKEKAPYLCVPWRWETVGHLST